jgi:uncharacterized protein (TIGR00255 family)
MPNSMTGFARKSITYDNVIIEIEIRSLNSRFLDLSLKMPKIYLEFENTLRALVSEVVSRGRVEISINRNDSAAPAKKILFNENLFQQYFLKAEEQIELISKSKLTSDLKQNLALEILTRKDVFETTLVGDVISGSEADVVRELLKATLNELKIMRAHEGLSLLAHLQTLIADLTILLNLIESQRESSKNAKAEELNTRLASIKIQMPIDQQRVAQELAILIEKSDISEEIERLKSHIKQFESSLSKSGAGKKLEFLVQECLREVNTIGSKVADAKIIQNVIESKSVLEKLREQVANIE